MARSEWNHRPDTLPLQVNPLFRWPLRPVAVVRWYWESWFPLTQNLLLVGLACVAWAMTGPVLEEAASPGWWIAGIWLRNFVLAGVLAQSLHFIFHSGALQGGDHKYDPRPFPREGRMFTFRSQYWDNVFWTLASGVTVWSLWEALIWWAMANGYAPVWSWADGGVWFLAVFLLIPVWESFYFYWMHRLLHTDLFYRFHALHHRNTDVGPWSGLSMHPFEHVMYFGTALIHFVVPTHPVHVVAHLMFFGLYAITTHTGFEGLWSGGRKRVHLGNFHHQMHHRYFEVNYGTLEVPWDLLFGTFHDGSEAGKAQMQARLKTRTRRTGG